MFKYNTCVILYMTERKSRIDEHTKNKIVKAIGAFIVIFSIVAVMLMVMTYFQREDIISEIEMAKNVTQTVAFNFTGGNP